MTAVPRRRLDPQVRRDLILDEAARVVAGEGVSAVSMERIGREAGISKALVYNYFPTRQVLLSELLLREYARFKANGRAAARNAADFESLVRATTRAYLDYVRRYGVIIQRLMNEPAVAAAMRTADAEGRQHTIDLFGARLVADFGLDPRTAATLTELLMGVTGAAGDLFSSRGGDAAPVEDLVVEIIMAAVRQVAATRGGRPKP